MSLKPGTGPALILTALRTPGAAEPVYTAEEIVIRAWRASPELFGLRGRLREYPDSHRVFSNLMGTNRGLVGKGYLRKRGHGLYELTDAGRAEADRLMAAPPPGPKSGKKVYLVDGAADPFVVMRKQLDDAVPDALPPACAPGSFRANVEGTQFRSKERIPAAAETDALYRRVLGSAARAKWRDGKLPEIDFQDAYDFWGLRPEDGRAEIDARLDGLKEALEAARRACPEGGCLLGDGKTSVTKAEIWDLLKLHEHLERRYGGHLTQMRVRSGRGAARS